MRRLERAEGILGLPVKSPRRTDPSSGSVKGGILTISDPKVLITAQAKPGEG